MITGANAGIGKATALGLAMLGATVVMVCRNPDLGRAAAQEIKDASGNQNVDLMVADLSSQAGIRQLAADFKARCPRLDVLINNAGIALFIAGVYAYGRNWFEAFTERRGRVYLSCVDKLGSTDAGWPLRSCRPSRAYLVPRDAVLAALAGVVGPDDAQNARRLGYARVVNSNGLLSGTAALT